MSRTSPISGFPEFLPSQRFVEQWVTDRLREVFELHGFASVETRAVEPLDELLRKGETDHEIYVLSRLQAMRESADGQALVDQSDLGLHYDLTVPFARYVLENAGRLDFPFRRYQIQRCWRGERPQEGRYREFTQADIDIVGRDVLPFHFDVEVAEVMAQALARLPLPPLTLQVNSRTLIEGFYRGIGVTDVAGVIRTVDKLDRAGEEATRDTLTETCGLSAEQAELCLALASIRSTDTSFVARVRDLGVSHPLLDEGLTQLTEVVEGAAAAASERFTVSADLRIARGLDYYTGTVFETRMLGFEHLGSVCSGGRYDSLASDERTRYPGVGISLGVTRLLAPLVGRGLLDSDRRVPSCVLVALPDEESRARCRSLAAALRARGVAAEVAPEPSRYGRQIRYAERRGIPYVWFPQPDGRSEVRDIRSGDQRPADPDSWRPPEVDLRPRVITTSLHDPAPESP